MLKSITRYSQFNLMKNIMIGVLFLYSVVVTIAFIGAQPKLTVISIEDSGTYLVKENTQAQKKSERVRFVTQFLKHLYSYDETNFDERMSMVGDMFTRDLWEKKNAEFKSISEKIKFEPVTLKLEITDIREIDEHHYEADLKGMMLKRLQKTNLSYRINIEVRDTPRSERNPYPYEVVSYAEQVN